MSLPSDVGGLPVEEIARRVKVELRDRLRKIRKAIPEAIRAEKSAKIAERVAAHPAWARSKSVMLFVPLRTEVDVRLLEARARAAGKTIVAPRMEANELSVRRWEPGAEVPSGTMGVLEPPKEAAIEPDASVDVVIVPALALDPSGGRLGYGAGLYDRLLPRLENATTIGVAFDFQLLAEVPMSERDTRVKVVITDERTIEVER